MRDVEDQILLYITERIKDGMSPTVREIGAALGISSTSTVHKYIKILSEKGYIITQDNLNRSITLNSTAANPYMDRVPLVGNVAAGSPILAIENITDYISFSNSRYSNDELFALNVRGESMIEAAILDGDIIICHKTSVARNGEIVVALIEDEATVKTFYKEKGHFRLQPQNEDYEPIIVNDVKILGKVISVIRNYE